MRKEYDFSKGVRGKFYVKKSDMHLPVYLDEKIQKFYSEKAKLKGKTMSELVNQILSKEIEISKALN